MRTAGAPRAAQQSAIQPIGPLLILIARGMSVGRVGPRAWLGFFSSATFATANQIDHERRHRQKCDRKKDTEHLPKAFGCDGQHAGCDGCRDDRMDAECSDFSARESDAGTVTLWVHDEQKQTDLLPGVKEARGELARAALGRSYRRRRWLWRLVRPFAFECICEGLEESLSIPKPCNG
jgi:hypothetical protein